LPTVFAFLPSPLHRISGEQTAPRFSIITRSRMVGVLADEQTPHRSCAIGTGRVSVQELVSRSVVATNPARRVRASPGCRAGRPVCSWPAYCGAPPQVLEEGMPPVLAESRMSEPLRGAAAGHGKSTRRAEVGEGSRSTWTGSYHHERTTHRYQTRARLPPRSAVTGAPAPDRARQAARHSSRATRIRSAMHSRRPSKEVTGSIHLFAFSASHSARSRTRMTTNTRARAPGSCSMPFPSKDAKRARGSYAGAHPVPHRLAGAPFANRMGATPKPATPESH
jgi:hypothetical protein